jgi:hypothetical protein
MAEIWYEKCAYIFNVYKNQLSRQTGSRNLMGPKTLPVIWGTYIKLLTKYQISAINSCWEKYSIKDLNLLYPRSPKGEGSILFYLCPSFRPSKIFFVAFFSVTVDGRNLIFGLWPNIRSLSSIVAEKNVTKNVHICSMWIKSN